MTYQIINNFILYFSLAWFSNICLNLLYVAKKYIPKIKKIDKPIDFFYKYKKDRLLGDSTTVLGLIVCLLISSVLFILKLNSLYFFIPISVYLGHTFGSFIKRRMHKKGGEFAPFIDHGDYVIFTGIVFVLFGKISFLFAVVSILLTYILHPIACLLAFNLKLRKFPY